MRSFIVSCFAFTVLVLFSACSSKEQSVPMTQAPVVLKWYTESDEATNIARKYPELIADFEASHPGIHVELKALVETYNHNEYLEKVKNMLKLGEQIDLIITATMIEAKNMIDAGYYEPLDTYAQSEGVDLRAEYKGILPIDGRIYTIPWKGTFWLVFINKDMLDAAGLPLPPLDWTWADYREYARRLTHGTGDSKVYGSYFHHWDWFYSIGMQSKIMDKPYYKPDGTPNFSDPIFRQGMKFRYDLENVDKSQVPMLDIIQQSIGYRQVFFSGKAAMEPMGAWLVSDILILDKYPHTFKTTFAAFPRWDKTCKPNTSTLDGAGSGWGINARSKHKNEAYTFLRYMTTHFDEAKQVTTASKKADLRTILDGMKGSNETLYDLEALKRIALDPQRQENVYTYVGPGEQEAVNIYIQENKKYLVGSESLDQAMKTITEQAKLIAARSQRP